MKQRISYYTMLAVVALMCATGCSKEDTDNNPAIPEEPVAGSTGVNVQFTAGLGAETRTSHEPDGKTPGGFVVKWKGYNDNQSNYDKVGIVVENPDNNILVSGAKNIPYRPTTSGTSSPLEADGTALAGLEAGKTYNFYSYYPYVEGQSITLEDVDVPELNEQTQAAPGDNTHIGTYDFMYAEQKGITIETGNNPPTVNFQYKHLFTSLQFNLTNGRNATVKINKITLERQDGSGLEILISSGIRTTTSSYAVFFDFQQLTVTSPTDLAAGGTQKFWMMLYPASIGDATELKLSVYLSDNDGSYVYTLKKAVPAGGFEAGGNYTLEMNVKDTGLTAGEETWREIISTAEELAAFRERVNSGNNYSGKTVYLAGHITLTGEWTPIGNDYNTSFDGTFDGDGYSISNLNVNTTAACAGLFGRVYGGTVCNLRVSGTVKTTGEYAGGIVGRIFGDGTVENCIFCGTVEGLKYIGGIAGENGRQISGCYTLGSVKAESASGGICGINDGSINDCYSSASVEAEPYHAGGIVGYFRNGNVARCYATGVVSSVYTGGGIAGYAERGVVEKCIALNFGVTQLADIGGNKLRRIVGNNSGCSVTDCAAFAGMVLPGGITATDNANGDDGASLPAADCLTPAAYTSRGFPEATATTPGWAFDTGATWQYLPWNKAFESFHNISETDYRIGVPAHLTGGGTVN